MGYPVAVRRWT